MRDTLLPYISAKLENAIKRGEAERNHTYSVGFAGLSIGSMGGFITAIQPITDGHFSKAIWACLIASTVCSVLSFAFRIRALRLGSEWNATSIAEHAAWGRLCDAATATVQEEDNDDSN